MGSEDEDELASLRVQRAARLGLAGVSLGALRKKHRASRDSEDNTFAHRALDRRPGTSRSADSEDDEADGEGVALEDDPVLFDDRLRSQLPMSFGDQEKKVVSRASSMPPGEADAVGGDAGLGEEEEEADPYHLPISHEVALERHSKIVCALDVDHSGARVVSGSRDYTVRMYDFGGMKSDMRSFRSLEPFEGHPVHALSFSPSGDAFLAVTGSAKIKVFDRDGMTRGESLQGDMYIRDQKNTKAHVSPCTNGQWHPEDRYTAMTSSEDGTVRIWDTSNVEQKTVIKPTLAKPGRVAVSSATYNGDGSLIAAGLVDGTIQLWDAKGKFGSSAAVGQVLAPKAQMLGKQDWRYVSGGGRVVRRAHQPGTEITCLRVSFDNQTLLSRSADETLKVWDVRKFQAPVHTFSDLPTHHSTTQCCFSPDGRLVLTGVSADRDGVGGGLVFLDLEQRQVVRKLAMPGSVVAVQWHVRLNQIFVGTGDKMTGAVRILYDPTLSEKGVLLCAGRKPRAPDPLDFQAPLVIHTPHALPMFREDGGKRKLRGRDKERADPAKMRKPDPGETVTGLGKGGKLGSTGGTLLTQYILKNHGKLHNPAEEDIRAAILRHGDKPEDDFSKLYSAAYKDTQPKPIYAEASDEDEDPK
ncbi:hypothetical protein WJX72_004992 [[Myrmecia] bisecta]|uniref:WD repeat-containing protein 70 n=1 Tax=[Myrmecia] bisecta TaxID=41462 RepID=A0AAW1PSB2_9CHLO